MIWAGAILTLNYVEIPGYKQEQKIDPTFIASVFTGVLATFGVQAGNKKTVGGGSANISKKDMEFLIQKASETAPWFDANGLNDVAPISKQTVAQKLQEVG